MRLIAIMTDTELVPVMYRLGLVNAGNPADNLMDKLKISLMVGDLCASAVCPWFTINN